MRLKYLLLNIILIFANILFEGYARENIDLSGKWHYRLTGAPSSIPGEGEISLPNTLDNAHKTVYTPQGDITNQLRREFSFTGEATYSKKITIPSNWHGKEIFLNLERTKPTSIIIDGVKAGSNSRISAPQIYNLTEYLTPGTHTIEISVNNLDSIPPIVARSSHAVAESTQTNWNGILGNFYLEARNKFHIREVKVVDHEEGGAPKLKVIFSEPAQEEHTLTLNITDGTRTSKRIMPGTEETEFSIALKDEDFWSPFNPVLKNLNLSLKNNGNREIDNYELQTGFRNFTTSGDFFIINETPTFLRGTVNAAVFPLTAYAPTDEESWLNYFKTLKSYGLNHVRFHSWTPPEAAFKAADETGFFLLTELPIWGELDRDLHFHNRFLQEDLKGIMEAYATHPSFVMFSPGNELFGDITLMKEYMNEAKSLNPRILASYGTNVYLGMNGQMGGEDFIICSKTSDDANSAVRGSMSFADTSTGGHFNSSYPNSDYNVGAATEGITVPIIVHEAGQYQSYPDYDEIGLYTGALKPDNLIEFKKRAEKAGTLRKNKEFTEASGKWVALLYKAEMEMAQRSPGIAGIELFGFQDYPGQGTAEVGLLNPFMQTKGFITPETWKGSSADLALMAEFPKFCFYEGETVELPVLSINFTDNPDAISNILWETGFDKGSISATPGNGVIENEAISFKLPAIDSPQEYSLTLSTAGGDVSNTYNFWAYPKNLPKVSNVAVTRNLGEALILLDQGERVILCPDENTVAKASLDPLFTPDFWNYRMFRTICDEMHLTPSPGTLGLLINENHPALEKFPTENHTNWQWFPIVSNSRPLIIDRLPKNVDPIVEVIDNVERNFRLALLLECNVGKGKLLILSANPDKLQEYPEGKWFMQSLKEYIGSKDFKPEITLTQDQLVNLVTKPSNARLVKELKNETYNSKW